MVKIILSNVAQYQALFEQVFFEFLVRKNVAVKTQINYRTDLRHFMIWLWSFLDNEIDTTITSYKALLATITPWTIHQYKTWMVTQETPATSINRRLSALRTFFQCCQDKSWLHINPASSVPNIKTHHIPSQQKEINLLEQFRQSLQSSGAAKGTVKNYLADVSDFLIWVSKQSRQTL